HAVPLSFRENIHAVIIDEIHIIHIHISIRAIIAANDDRIGTTPVRGCLWRSISYMVIAAIGISPGMDQVQPVADFVGSGSASVKGSKGRSYISECRIQDDDPISFLR